MNSFSEISYVYMGRNWVVIVIVNDPLMIRQGVPRASTAGATQTDSQLLEKKSDELL
jgi:hypothetical protein